MSAVSLALAGCSEDVMDRINQDTSHTNSVDGKFILADLITSTAFSNVSGDFNTYSSSYVEYEVGIENQLYNAEIRLNEPSASSTFENTWGNVYTSLKNARIIIGQCQEGKRDEGNLVTRGIAEVMEAYNGALLADIFGDTPYSEASLVVVISTVSVPRTALVIFARLLISPEASALTFAVTVYLAAAPFLRPVTLAVTVPSCESCESVPVAPSTSVLPVYASVPGRKSSTYTSSRSVSVLLVTSTV